MARILVVDSNSIFDFNKFYVFDKYNEKEIYTKLTNFLLSKIKSGEIIIIDKVYENELKYLNGVYLFSWDDVPGNDSKRLLKFLKENLKIKWMENAKIEKSNDSKVITITKESNSLIFKLNKKESKANLEINGGESHEYILKEKDGKLNIYNGVNIKKLKEVIKPFVVNTLFLFPKVQDLIKNNFREEIVRLYNYSEGEIEQILRKYENKHADLYLIAYCKYLKQERIGINPILITEETFRDDKKLIEKIPAICRKEKIEFRKVPYALFEIYKDELKFKLEVESK